MAKCRKKFCYHCGRKLVILHPKFRSYNTETGEPEISYGPYYKNAEPPDPKCPSWWCRFKLNRGGGGSAGAGGGP